MVDGVAGADGVDRLARTWARQHGMVSTFHTGGPSIAGSSAIRAEVVLEAQPDIVGHVNGGTTALLKGFLATMGVTTR